MWRISVGVIALLALLGCSGGGAVIEHRPERSTSPPPPERSEDVRAAREAGLMAIGGHYTGSLEERDWLWSFANGLTAEQLQTANEDARKTAGGAFRVKAPGLAFSDLTDDQKEQVRQFWSWQEARVSPTSGYSVANPPPGCKSGPVEGAVLNLVGWSQRFTGPVEQVRLTVHFIRGDVSGFSDASYTRSVENLSPALREHGMDFTNVEGREWGLELSRTSE